MNETVVLMQLGPFTLTAFGLCIAAGILLAVGLVVLLGRKDPGLNSVLSLCAASILGALMGARILYCLTMLDFILVDLGGLGFIPALWQGGYTLYGAVLGGGAGAWLYSRVSKGNTGRMLDLAAVGGALVLAFERGGEYFTTQGLGEYIWEEAWCRFPFAVESLYGDWQIPVFLYEALCALIITLVLSVMVNRRPAGRTAEVFIVLVGTTQILLESLREDEFIRFGFIRLNMLAAAVTLGILLCLRLFHTIRKGGWTPWQGIRIALFILGVVSVIMIEFALDKTAIDSFLLYLAMAASLIVMALSLLLDGRSKPAYSR